MSDGAADNGNGSGGSSQAEQPQLNSQEAVVQRFRMLQNDVQMLSSKSTELELERQEHDLVLEALDLLGPAGSAQCTTRDCTERCRAGLVEPLV